MWGARDMSLRGKSTIIQTYGMSKLNYLASLLPSPPDYIKTRITRLFFSFLWDGKPDKIKRDVVVNWNGGLNIPHFETKCHALNIQWVKRYVDGDAGSSQWVRLVNYKFKM